MLRSVLVFLFSLTLTTAVSSRVRAEDVSGDLHGRVEGRIYVSPTGVFKVSVPVLTELGGEISDTSNVVTFSDSYNTYISIATIPLDATQRRELSTRGAKDFLAYFFTNVVLAEFKKAFEGARNESARFAPNQLDGALFTSTLIPGGSMFSAPQFGDSIPVAKRGNLLFVQNEHLFVVSVELAERIIEGSAYKKTTAEEDEILLKRLNAVINRIQFATLPAIADAAAKDAAKDAKK